MTMKRELATESLADRAARVSRRDRDAVGAGGAASRTTLLSRLTIDTRAPATGSPLSRRVTKTSVFCGLSLTLMPRFVTWTRSTRVSGLSRVASARSAIGAPSSTAAQTRPVPPAPSALRRCRARATGCDPAVTSSWRGRPVAWRRQREVAGLAAAASSASARRASTGAAHCVHVRKLRA